MMAVLLDVLGDGRVHSGEALANRLGVSRTAVWKSIERLRGLGLEVESLPRAGYRMARAVELLDAAQIKKQLPAAVRRRLRHLDLHFETDSTNTRLLEAPPLSFATADVCLAETQSMGRGRRGRRWLAPFGTSLAMSVSWNFREQPKELGALTLAAGVAIVAALERCGAANIGLKWPNDLLFNGRKLGGILTELRAEVGGPAFVVIGIGLNVALDAGARRSIEASRIRVADIAEACAHTPSRQAIAVAVLSEVVDMLQQFEAKGFAAYVDRWSRLDMLAGKPARVQVASEFLDGIARGIDGTGALRLEVAGRIQRFVSGEASLRPAPGGAA
jgi:BirA family transcriptional regulator, biotin operon repressor / biotin---[acetyl-CoA-carboxylase] ligase